MSNEVVWKICEAIGIIASVGSFILCFKTYSKTKINRITQNFFQNNNSTGDFENIVAPTTSERKYENH